MWNCTTSLSCHVCVIEFVCILSAFSVWSDDDWLKKFSGKTTEDSEEAVSASGEPANTTTTQEVRYCTDAVDHL